MSPTTASINAPLWGARARDWAEVQEATALAAFEAVVDRAKVGQGTRLLDLGCGSGMAARLAADRGASVAGIDAAEPLLAIARERTPEGDFRDGDLEALPFADASFDLVTAFNAIQYAGNPSIALAEARRVLAPGGTLSIMVWGEPEGMEMASVITALRPLLPPPPPGAGGPFALSGEAALRDLVEGAGLTITEIFGVAARAIGLSGEEAVTQAHTIALAPFAQPDGSYRIGAAFRCLFATA